MSAFIVNNEVISKILGCYAACWRAGGRLSDTEIKEMGQQLLDANCISVNYRYNEQHERVFELDEEVFDRRCSMVQAIVYCDCLDYQSCEYPQWYRSEAKALLNKMRETFICHLPGYEEAEWG